MGRPVNLGDGLAEIYVGGVWQTIPRGSVGD
jgi:hypothetical protein